jgi:4-diphosphocytidyl-2-C-methyl-D-erythritol kinase
MQVEKRIPVGGGLGGGSSDAARMLLALAYLWRLDGSAAIVAEKVVAVAQSLGSDVPFFLFGPSSICQGRGEIVQPVAPPRPGWALLILPQGISMPTGLVYQRFDALALGKAQARLDPPWPADRGDSRNVSRDISRAPGQEWLALSNVEETSLTSDELLPRLVNDLEEPAFAIAPELGRLRSELEQTLGRIVRMSGSGSTLFTLYDDERNAQSAARIITNRNIRAMAVKIAPPIHDDLENEKISV